MFSEVVSQGLKFSLIGGRVLGLWISSEAGGQNSNRSRFQRIRSQVRVPGLGPNWQPRRNRKEPSLHTQVLLEEGAWVAGKDETRPASGEGQGAFCKVRPEAAGMQTPPG